MVGTGWRPLEDAPPPDVQGCQLLETGIGFPQFPQGSPQFSGPYRVRFFLSFLIFQLATVFVCVSEWTEIKVVMTDCNAKKTVL